MDIITKIHSDLASEISELNNIITVCLNSQEELVGLVGKHLIDAGGKRIRPLLTIITAKLFGYTGSASVKLAGAVEFIHTATLLHDDVVDDSMMRRFQPTAHTIWGSKASILVGDYLFSQSFQLMVASNSIKAMQSLSEASTIISEGEVSQLIKLKQRRIIDATEYHDIVNAKTAELFGAACEVGAIIAQQDDNICKIMRDFGRSLGHMFQIIDDLFDYLGGDGEIGKNVGDDFLEGKVTLPLIFLYEKLGKNEQRKIEEMIKADKRSEEEFELVKNLMVSHEIVPQIMEYLDITKNAAQKLFKQIMVENVFREHLIALLDFSIHRNY